MYTSFSSDDLVEAKRSSSFPEFDLKSTHVSGFNQAEQLLYQVAVPMSTEEEPKPDDTCLWTDTPTDKHLYEAAAQFSDE